MNIYIGTDGEIQFVYDDMLAEVFEADEQRVRRASHVEPDQRGGWIADMSPVGGPMLGADGVACEAEDVQPFKTRTAALDAEREWLNAMLSAHQM